MEWWQDLQQQGLSAQSYAWLLDASIAIVLTLLLSLAWRKTRKKLTTLAEKTDTHWDDLVISALGIPINWLIAVIGISWLADISARHFSSEIVTSIPVVRQLALLLLVTWAIWRLISRIEDRQLIKGNDPTTVQLVGKIIKMAVSILIVLPVFQILGISISGILAFGGVGGLVVGMAAKDLLSNFFGSLMIYLDRPFKVGDWIRSPDRNIEGTVEKIGFRLTIIRTFDKRPLYVPNSVFASISVENPSRMKNRRIQETIGVRYQDAQQLKALLDAVRAMLEQHPDIDQRQTLIVNFNSFGPSSLDFFIYTFTRTTNWVQFHHIKQDVMLRVLNIIHEHGADCAFPTRTLHLQTEPLELQSTEQ